MPERIVSAGYLRKCAGKQRHETKDEANAHRRALAAAGTRMDKTNAYRCAQCGKFHVGHIGVNNRGRG